MMHLTIGVVGNPNCGKTTLFNALTGSKQHVGNWPGVTVDRKVGYYKHNDYHIDVVDLPGIYSLDIVDGTTSLDERITQDYILSNEADLIINIIDASNLERNLYLTTQLLEMGVPMLIALNMMDIAKQRQIIIDLTKLSQQLGTEVIPLIASHNEGITYLKQAIEETAKQQHIPSLRVEYHNVIEKALADLHTQLLPQLEDAKKPHARWICLKLLENDPTIQPWVDKTIIEQAHHYQQNVEENLEEDVDTLIADSRYTLIASIIGKTVKKQGKASRTLSDTIDRVVLNRFLGLPIFLFVMYLMFLFTINIGSAFVDFFDLFVGALLVEGLSDWLTQLNAPLWLITLFSTGIGGGIQVVATFIPIIGFLYLFLSFLEDSGYMSRAAFVMDRFMYFIGLPGKSFVPLIVGFGCNVPGIMASRTLESQKDRLLTILMTPFMSCGARLPVYALFAAAFFPVGGQNVVFGLYLIGIALAVLTGFIMRHTLLPGESTHFMMELPSYHLPTLRNIGLRTWERLNSFIFQAGKVIVPMVVVLSFLNSWGTDGSYGNENTDRSVLSEIGRTFTPILAPIGIAEDNWPAMVGIFTGILAKEAVVGTLDSIYSQLGDAHANENQAKTEPFALLPNIQAAFATIPTNLGQITDSLLDPLGLNIGDVTDLEALAEKQSLHSNTFGEMARQYDGAIGAFAYLLFILLYFPCAAATATIYKESSLKWTIFVTTWTTGIAFVTATLFYQIATFQRHPTTSTVWVVGLSLSIIFIIIGLRWYGQHNRLTTIKQTA